MTQCSYPQCRESDDLNPRKSVSNDRVYHYCDDHDPLGGSRSAAFEEIHEEDDDGE